MAQTALAVTILKQNNYAVQAGDLTVTFASDTTNGNSFPATGREIILAYNSDTVAHTFTVTSQPDSLGRTADIAAYSVAAGAVAAIEASVLNGWINSSGNVTIAHEDHHSTSRRTSHGAYRSDWRRWRNSRIPPRDGLQLRRQGE